VPGLARCCTVLAEAHIWQPRFYDFVVFTEKKRSRNSATCTANLGWKPVKRGLVLEPQQWAWSSFRHHANRERGMVLVNEPQKAELHVKEVA
jgi:putative transposase